MATTYGIDYPFRDSSKGDYLNMTEIPEKEIRANLIHLILTRRGSRYYLPDLEQECMNLSLIRTILLPII